MLRDYDSFAMGILSQNHREIDIAELMSISINVVIAVKLKLVAILPISRESPWNHYQESIQT